MNLVAKKLRPPAGNVNKESFAINKIPTRNGRKIHQVIIFHRHYPNFRKVANIKICSFQFKIKNLKGCGLEVVNLSDGVFESEGNLFKVDNLW